MSEQPETKPERTRHSLRFLPIILFIFAALLLFIGGIAALLYWAFTEYTNFRSTWVLVCCLPVGVVLVGVMVMYSLYTRYGEPLRQIFAAIDSVSAGDLSVRVPADDSPQFGELIKRFNKMIGELERAGRQRRELTADIAHELRTPLHILQGKLEGIQDGIYAPTREHIGDALDETKLLARLVDDLQTLSLAEGGQLPMHPTRFALADLLRDAAASFSTQAAAQGVELKVEATEPGLEVEADYLRLSQVLANLLSNALRYTPAGGRVALSALAASTGRVSIRVRDTGSGIPAEDLPFIFDRFWRGERARTRGDHASSGLGLAISRQLVLAQGGAIEARSEVGRGSEFTIELPAAQS